MMRDPFSQFPVHRATFPSTASSSPSQFSAFSRSPSTNSSLFSSSTSSSTTTHNLRFAFAFALIPTAAFLLDLGGTPVISILTVGLLISYILDSLRLKVAYFLAIWFSLIYSQLAFFFTVKISLHSGPLMRLAILLCAETTLLIGVWFSLQFKWIQVENPSMIRNLERVLFACLPVSMPVLYAWAVVAGLGMDNAAYYLMVFCCIFYWVFSIPRKSGFTGSKEGSRLNEDWILSPLESCMHTLYVLFMPVLFRTASHHSVVFKSVVSFCDLLLLFFVSFLFQLYASTRGALWWVTKDSYQVHQIRVVNGAVALLVTVAMLGGGLAADAYAVGMIADAVSSVGNAGFLIHFPIAL